MAATKATPPRPKVARVEVAPLEPELELLPLPEVEVAVELVPVRVGPEFEPAVPLGGKNAIRQGE